MAKNFNGKIAVDIRDSEPDWGPYLAPQAAAGAPNVLMITGTIWATPRWTSSGAPSSARTSHAWPTGESASPTFTPPRCARQPEPRC